MMMTSVCLQGVSQVSPLSIYTCGQFIIIWMLLKCVVIELCVTCVWSCIVVFKLSEGPVQLSDCTIDTPSIRWGNCRTKDASKR